jgi:hypothetical protein
MRISRHDLRRRYSNSLVIDAGSQFSLRACSQANKKYMFKAHCICDISTSLCVGFVYIKDKKNYKKKICNSLLNEGYIC